MPSSKKYSADFVLFSVLGYTFIGAIVLFCAVPFLLVISGSFTKESEIFQLGYSFWPKEASLEAYQLVFKNPTAILNAYMISILVTAVGTGLSLFLTAMTGYVLQKKDFQSRNAFALFFYFTTLFSGGLVPWYILMQRYLGMSDSILALIVPLLFNVFYIIIMRSFLKTIPEAIFESARIDGAGEFRTFLSIVLPLAKPALATVGLFTALNYWNDWQNAMLFINSEERFPLQYFLMKLLNSLEFIKMAASRGANIPISEMPAESFKLAMTVVATGPIVFLFPFVQKYFIKGLNIGAVKG